MTEKLTIALVSAFPPGLQSLNEYGYHLARELAARDDVGKVIVLADKLENAAPELEISPKVEVRRVWRFNGLATMPAILKNLRQVRADGVIYNVQTASFGDSEIPAALGLMTPMLTRWLGTTSGVIAHNIVAGIDLEKTILGGQPVRQAIVKIGGAIVSRALSAASYVTVTLPSYEEHLKSRYPRADITHVPHGTFDTDERVTRALKDRPERIVTMGKFGTYKRLETLLAAFDELRLDQRFANFELVIGGTDHPNTPGYVESVARSRADDTGVRFHGYVAETDIPEFFGEARLSVFDYDATTGSSGVLHQTASYGAVPVFPKIGDFVDVCEAEGLCGYHYAPGDAEDMSAVVARALADLPAAEALGKANRQTAMDMPLAEVLKFHVNKIKENSVVARQLETARDTRITH